MFFQLDDIFNSAVAKTLPTLPFQVLRCLLDALPIHSEEGRTLRRVMVDLHATHFILACLAIFTHQNCDPVLVPGLQHEVILSMLCKLIVNVVHSFCFYHNMKYFTQF